VHNYVEPFTSRGKLLEFGAKKPISWGKPAHFDFFAINFTDWSHILSTGGDALKTYEKTNSVSTLQNFWRVITLLKHLFIRLPPDTLQNFWQVIMLLKRLPFVVGKFCPVSKAISKYTRKFIVGFLG